MAKIRDDGFSEINGDDSSDFGGKNKKRLTTTLICNIHCFGMDCYFCTFNQA